MQCSGLLLHILTLHLAQHSANNRFPLSFCFDLLPILFPLTDSVFHLLYHWLSLLWNHSTLPVDFSFYCILLIMFQSFLFLFYSHCLEISIHWYTLNNIYIIFISCICIYTHFTLTHTCGSSVLFLFYHACAAPQGSTTHQLDLWCWKKHPSILSSRSFFPSYTVNLLLPPFSHEPHRATTKDKWAYWPTADTTQVVCVCKREEDNMCTNVFLFVSVALIYHTIQSYVLQTLAFGLLKL